MKAAYIKEVGPPENIIYGELPAPQPKGSAALVKVRAVDVNPIDVVIRAGTVVMPLPIPFILGCDLAGVVEAVCPRARRFKPGDRVWCPNQGLLGRQGTVGAPGAVEDGSLCSTPARRLQ